MKDKEVLIHLELSKRLQRIVGINCLGNSFIVNLFNRCSNNNLAAS